MRPAAPSWTRNTGRAMSEENAQIVRRVFDALQHPNAAVRALWHPDVEFDVSRDIWGALVGGGRYRGIEGVRSWMLDLYSGWEKMDLSCEELIDAGEQVIAVLRVRGRGRVSGIELEYRPAGVWTLRQGKIVRVVWYRTREEALGSVGVQG
jgi:ketosteroid isomerase-like protein